MKEQEIRDRFQEVTTDRQVSVDVSAAVRAGIWDFIKDIPENVRVGDLIAALEGER
ncbi:hypothetical protein LWC05_16265 [Acetobacter sicerae]|uniref:Uncharacterized protein n=1 Tax=Acetobacter sicerae TaxID=85325 RepID=A0ABS8W1G8_9PROT|nr:hypothetical protein [Acetobacter sicerae]MCE0745429.1 hypothetical protein [Acetobacter sicerae]